MSDALLAPVQQDVTTNENTNESTKALGQEALFAIAQQDAAEKQALQAAIDNVSDQLDTIDTKATSALATAEDAAEDVAGVTATVNSVQSAVDTLSGAVTNINGTLVNMSDTLGTIIGNDAGLSMRQIAEDVSGETLVFATDAEVDALFEE